VIKFKDDLRKYPWPRSSAIKAHRKRWLQHVDAEKIWRKISGAAGQLEPADFIRFVITARVRASGLVPTLDFHAEAGRRYLAAHEARIKAALKSKMSLSEIADILDDAASDFRFHDTMLDNRLSGLPINVISQKNQKGSQARRAFCLILFEFFQERCRTHMDGEVATLLDIAMPRKKPTTLDEVREFRRKRPSKDFAILTG
jgi:hypothetical protein